MSREEPATLSGHKAINEFLRIVKQGDEWVFQCVCGQILGDARRNFKEYTLIEEGPVKEAGLYVNPFDVGGRFVFRQFYCPGCLRRLDTEICLRGEPVLWNVQIALD